MPRSSATATVEEVEEVVESEQESACGPLLPEEVFVDPQGLEWRRGTKIFLGWPHLQARQLRVCLEVKRPSKKRVVGLFARVGPDPEGGKTCAADTPLMFLALHTDAVAQVQSKVSKAARLVLLVFLVLFSGD